MKNPAKRETLELANLSLSADATFVQKIKFLYFKTKRRRW
jgi:hypothetical protein